MGLHRIRPCTTTVGTSILVAFGYSYYYDINRTVVLRTPHTGVSAKECSGHVLLALGCCGGLVAAAT